MDYIDKNACEPASVGEKSSKGEVYLWMLISSLLCLTALVLTLLVFLLLLGLFVDASAIAEDMDSTLTMSAYKIMATMFFLALILLLLYIVFLKTKFETTRENCKIVAVAVFAGFCVATFWLVVFSFSALISPSGLFLTAVALFAVPSILLLRSAWKERDLDAKRKGFANSAMLSMAIISIMLAVFMPIAQELGSSDQMVCSCDQCVSLDQAMADA